MSVAIRHIGLVVSNLEAALRFWCEVLGFREVRRLDETGSFIDALLGLPNVRVTTVKLAAPDGNLVELLHFRSHPDQPRWEGEVFSTGLTHIALTVSGLEDLCSRLREEGVTFNSPPLRTPDGAALVAYGRGPEGLLLELVEPLT